MENILLQIRLFTRYLLLNREETNWDTSIAFFLLGIILKPVKYLRIYFVLFICLHQRLYFQEEEI